MSEIKITKDSLENAILRDGQFVSGYVNIDSVSIDASGYGAHAEGYAKNGSIIASGNGAHAEGISTQALADGAHAGGIGTIANSSVMTAIGQYNVSANTENTLFVVGDGTSSADANRSDAFRVVSGGSDTINPIPSSAQAKVNGISDVYLGCPIGTIVMWPGETAPEGWLLCDGSSLNIEGEYYNLYEIIITYLLRAMQYYVYKKIKRRRY